MDALPGMFGMVTMRSYSHFLEGNVFKSLDSIMVEVTTTINNDDSNLEQLT